MCDWCKEIYPEKDTRDIVFHKGKYDRDDFVEPDSFIVINDDGSFDIIVNPGDPYELGIIPDIKFCPYCGRDLAGGRGDAIRRQAVLDLIEHYNSDGLGSVFYGYEEGVKFANAVNKLPSVNPQEPKWIPVSERLPEKSGRYLAYIVNKHDDKLQYIMTCDYSADGYWNWFPDDECASDNVIAWMPLPAEPYKAESEEKE